MTQDMLERAWLNMDDQLYTKNQCNAGNNEHKMNGHQWCKHNKIFILVYNLCHWCNCSVPFQFFQFQQADYTLHFSAFQTKVLLCHIVQVVKRDQLPLESILISLVVEATNNKENQLPKREIPCQPHQKKYYSISAKQKHQIQWWLKLVFSK